MKLFGSGILFWRSFKNYDSILLLVIGLFIFAVSSWFSLGRLCISRNLSILLVHNYSQYSLMILCISVILIVTSLLFFIYSDPFFCFLMSMAICLSILSFQWTNSYFHWFSVSISFISTLFFIILTFHKLAERVVLFFVYRCKFRLFTWDYSCS